ncbi:uncharacterized protein MELLADRAFT_71836 [Melampsora larici-populina 98AG31]|uniref:Uncharacterized protein n=1 Tax=Melampsora larici-populina (strain 98AG31 / pathotype 3-4-7) TaxID=747676 RepID=F4RKX8_MELLP|nr:uncharacterized protein MELLADRAFT_71836 [Melampsora larici-populina 98AG31]EGG06957.1 hypothetical protein MELLADRAFT_71836 [Melampsora larici-populina 98AG31]
MCLYAAEYDAYEGWFCWPILRHARTLVFPIQDALGSWLHFFKEARKGKTFMPSTTSRDEGLFRNLPNLKQCLFQREPYDKELPLSLIEDFEAFGIKCFEIGELKPDEIMKLDAKLDTTLDQ